MKYKLVKYNIDGSIQLNVYRFRSPRIKDSRSSFVMHEKRRGKIDRKDYARKGEMSMSPIRTDKADWGQKANEKRSQIDDR